MNVFSFGDSPEMADALLALVIRGEKTATCSALRVFAAGGETMPEVGRRDCVLDGTGRRRAIVETLKLEILPFEAVPEEYAINAGEGWTSTEEWRDSYRAYLERNGGFEPGLKMLCERFRLVDVLHEDRQDD